ncbi:MAG: hypothetical protein IJD28_01500 [Deferribacterales bacterium]|nr:hypothetical protein [Deferribacterales bacterium]
MINSLTTAASAINAATSVSAVTADNIANVKTPSFKSRMSVLSDLSSGGVRLSAIKVNNSNGSLISTGNPHDVVVIGKNIEEPTPFYSDFSRSKFHIDDLGNLRSPNGDILFATAGQNVHIDESGSLYSNGQLVGRLEAVEEVYIPTGATILAGYVQASNVDLSSEIVNNMLNLRFMQANTVTVKTADEMLGTVINLKG